MGPTDYTVLENQEGIGGGIGKAPDGYPRSCDGVYVQVPDAEAALAKAESLGGTRIMGPDEVPGVGIVIGLFSDPEGPHDRRHVAGVIGSSLTYQRLKAVAPGGRAELRPRAFR